MKKALTLIDATAMFAAPAYAGNHSSMSSHSNMDSMSTDFSHYDADNNGEVTFKEFSKHAKAMNMSTTKAAQLFTKMSGGSPTLTQSNFQTAALSDPESFLASTTTSTRNTAVLSNVSSSSSMSSTQSYNGQTYNGMSINPGAGIDSTSPLTDMPSEQIMDSESTYNDFERTGEYDEPLGN